MNLEFMFQPLRGFVGAGVDDGSFLWLSSEGERTWAPLEDLVCGVFGFVLLPA